MIVGRTTGTSVGAIPVETGGSERVDRPVEASVGLERVDERSARPIASPANRPVVSARSPVSRPPAFDTVPGHTTGVIRV